MNSWKDKLSIPALMIVLGALVFSSCATTRRYQVMLDGFKGKSANDLVAALGPPDEIRPLADQTKVYRYQRIDKLDPTRRTSRTTASNPVSCVTSFVVNEQEHVTGWTMSGYDCRTR